MRRWREPRHGTDARCALTCRGGRGLPTLRALLPSATRRTSGMDTRFTARVIATVRRIPPGRVATYGDVAAAAGRPRASRAVGNIMRACSGRDVPCHRVVAAGGRLGGYGGNTGLKRALLQAEGVLLSKDRIRDFRAKRWPGRPAGRTGASRKT